MDDDSCMIIPGLTEAQQEICQRIWDAQSQEELTAYFDESTGDALEEKKQILSLMKLSVDDPEVKPTQLDLYHANEMLSKIMRA